MAGTNIQAALNSTLNVREIDDSGLALTATCTGVPPTTAGIFQHGCIIIRTDSGTGNKAAYENVGSSAVPSWNLLGDISAGEITLAEGNILIGNNSGVATALDIGNTNAGIAIGNGTTATIAALSGDVSMDNAGAVTIANSAVTNAKVADSNGTGALLVRKHAVVVYDFAVDGGTQGAIPLTGSPTIPDNAVCWLESYEVATQFTSGGADAATITLGFATDGDLFTGLAISDGANAWDPGVFAGNGALGVFSSSPVAVKTTAARTFQVTVAGGQDVTAGKAIFQVAYWVSE